MSNSNRGQGLPNHHQDILLPDGNYYFVCVGINKYQHVRQLNNAKTDAMALEQLLLERYQFEADYTETFYDQDATKQNLYNCFSELADKVKENDSLVIYFAGHGEYNPTWNQGFWVPQEGKSQEWDTLIPFSFLKTQIEAIKSFHTLIMADACYAGTLFTYRDIQDTYEPLERLDRIPSRYLITSGRNEIVPDGVPGEHSPFANSLLWNLKQNPDDLFGVVDLTRQLILDVAAGNNPIPRGEVLPMEGHRGGEFIFRKKGYQLPLVQELPPRRNYQFRKLSPSLEPQFVVTEEEVRQDLPSEFKSLKALQKAFLKLITATDLDSVFELFDKVLDFEANIYNSIILLQFRFTDYKKKLANRTEDPTDLQLSLNQISYALIEYTKELEIKDLESGIIRD